MPLGTQGGINLPIGYSDSALASGGVWTPDAARRFWAEHATPITELEDIRGETAKAEVGQRAALAWARSNLARLPRLMALKARDLWNDPWSDPHVGGCWSCSRWRRSPGACARGASRSSCGPCSP